MFEYLQHVAEFPGVFPAVSAALTATWLLYHAGRGLVRLAQRPLDNLSATLVARLDAVPSNSDSWRTTFHTVYSAYTGARQPEICVSWVDDPEIFVEETDIHDDLSFRGRSAVLRAARRLHARLRTQAAADRLAAAATVLREV